MQATRTFQGLASCAGNANQSGRVPASQHAARQRMAALWVAWLLGSLAVPLLRAHFFATETAAYRLQIFYYRSPSAMTPCYSRADRLIAR